MSSRLFSIEIYIFIEITLLGLTLLLKSLNLLIFFLSFEMQTFCLYALTLMKKFSLTSNEAGLKYFLTGALVSSFFILGSSYCYGFYGSLNLLELNVIVENKYFYFNFFSLFFFTTLFYKLGLFSLGQWMPDVYEASQNVITFFFSLIPKIVYITFLNILLTCLFRVNFISIYWVVVVFSTLSIIYNSLLSLNQIKIKRLLTYSGIVQVSYILIGISVQTISGLISSMFFLSVYLICTIVIWSIILNTENKNQNWFITDLIGFNRFNFLLSLSFFIILLNFSGLPPFMGFYSKFMILSELLDHNFYIIAWTIVLTSSLTIFYYLSISYMVFFKGLNNYIYNYIFLNLKSSYHFSFFLQSFLIFQLSFGLTNLNLNLSPLFQLVLVLIN